MIRLKTRNSPAWKEVYTRKTDESELASLGFYPHEIAAYERFRDRGEPLDPELLEKLREKGVFPRSRS